MTKEPITYSVARRSDGMVVIMFYRANGEIITESQFSPAAARRLRDDISIALGEPAST